MHNKLILKFLIILWVFILFCSGFLIKKPIIYDKIQKRSVYALRASDGEFPFSSGPQFKLQRTINTEVYAVLLSCMSFKYIALHNLTKDYDYKSDSEPTPYDLLLYQMIALTATNLAFLIFNLWYFFKFRRREKEFKLLSNKAETIRKLIEESVWFWGHGPQVLKNFDNLVAKGVTTITLETLTRTWTQHYKQQFQKISHLSEKEALERAENQKKQDILDLYELLKDKIDIKIMPITFGKYAGSDSYQFEVSDSFSANPKESK